jgi:hypothetical protein
MIGKLGIGNIITSGFLVLFTFLAVFTPSLSIIEPFKDYLIYALMVMMILGLIGLVLGSRLIMFSAFGCAMTIAIFLKNASNSDLKMPEANTSTQKLSIAHINLSSTSDPNDIVNLIKNHPVLDVISFQEYTPDWAAVLPQILAPMPYRIQSVDIDLYGKAIFSKIPLIDTVKCRVGGVPHMDASLQFKGKKIALSSVYLTPSLDKSSKEKAALQLDSLGIHIGQITIPKLIVGEFNQVYWSEEILKFRKYVGVLNSRRDVDISNPKMPYNHIFFSHELECYHFEEITDSLGSQIGCLGSFQFVLKDALKKSVQ